MGLKFSGNSSHGSSSQSKKKSLKDFLSSYQPLKSIKTIAKTLLDQPRHLLVLRLTLILLMLYGSSNVILDVPLQVICGLMLLSPSLITHRGLWIAICTFVWWINAANWLWIDNHQFLISYWCLVCALAVGSKNTDAVLAWNGRILVGLVFLFATVWKFLSGEYLDGSFLHFTFLIDHRVSSFATFVGKLDPQVLPQNQLLEDFFKDNPQNSFNIPLETSPLLEGFALIASYWTLVIEGAVAVVFLFAAKFRLQNLQNWILIIFIATTYFLLPVLGFAYVLIIMGLAQCSPNSFRVRMTYLILFGGLQLARLPWENFF